jgi:hypothetical protein
MKLLETHHCHIDIRAFWAPAWEAEISLDRFLQPHLLKS